MRRTFTEEIELSQEDLERVHSLLLAGHGGMQEVQWKTPGGTWLDYAIPTKTAGGTIWLACPDETGYYGLYVAIDLMQVSYLARVGDTSPVRPALKDLFKEEGKRLLKRSCQEEREEQKNLRARREKAGRTALEKAIQGQASQG